MRNANNSREQRVAAIQKMAWLAYSAGIADVVVANYLGSILPLLMCADLQLQAEAVTLVGWLACSSVENACAICNFDSFVSYVAILMGSTSARVQKQACWAMCAMSVGSNRAKITSVQVYDRFSRSLLSALGSSDASTQLYACRCVTCIVTDHASNGVLISRIIGLMDRLRNLKLSKDPEVSCEARCAEDLIARLSDGQMKADGALLLSNLS